MKNSRFSLLDSIVALSSVAIASAIFRSMSNYAINYDELNPGRRQPRTLWPSDAPVIESAMLIVLMTILWFLPLNAIIRKPTGSLLDIDRRYYFMWLTAISYLSVLVQHSSVPILLTTPNPCSDPRNCNNDESNLFFG